MKDAVILRRIETAKVKSWKGGIGCFGLHKLELPQPNTVM
jgi:hypothetical protein